jgi:hypothetical protein
VEAEYGDADVGAGVNEDLVSVGTWELGENDDPGGIEVKA